MIRSKKIHIFIAFIVPILVALIGSAYFQHSRNIYMNDLANQGVLAIYESGNISEEDIRWYIQHPPEGDGPILRALELTPEDVEGLDREQADWLEQELAQALLKRIIQHVALLEALTSNDNQQPVESVSIEVKKYKEERIKLKMESELDRITPSITRQEMLTYYVQHPQEFYEPGDRLARHIMLHEESSDESIRPATITQRLESGEDFQNLLQYSESETSSADGYIGWIEKGTISPPFERALWALDIHEVTGPIQVGDTWHFIQLIDKHEQGLIPFEQCQSQIQIRLIEEKSLQHRFRLLGIEDPESPNVDERYADALLKAAYKNEYDKDPELIEKVAAFERYKTADAVFFEHVQQRMKRYRDEDESTWYSESETAKRLLNQLRFKMIVELTPVPSAVDEALEINQPALDD
ncbi:MAG: peptidylprolyl isomerase [Candidatus Hinthialibacter antarcticus]|nr:peptidylprolyl isomerase [Candidatus Hinthialibacter antarcticus]